MAQVRFDKVRKAFGAAVAVEGLDLVIEDGAFVSLLGPSGCGKTTTLRMLAGLEFPTSGTIAIGDRVVNDVAPGKRDIAMVFQSYALYPHMTVGENIAYPLKKHGVAKPEREEKVAQVARTLQLEHLLARKPRQLSGGQQQRVALGRALVRDPQVFLLDEPLSNLDAKLRAHMRAELIELHRRVGRTFVYVTHDQLEAMTMSDKIAVMRDGVLQQYAPPKEVYDRPANMFVAGFIGTPPMNFLSGEMTGEPGRAAFRCAGTDLPVSLEDGALPERKVALGVRPEDVTLGEGPFVGTVRLVEPTGHETIVVVESPAGSLVTRAGADVALAIGERVPFDLEAERLHLFCAASEARLPATFGRAGAPAAA
ncbi:ABC transporter ATP-binding protein [Salinarimonas sp. NSM]|uniref:ABC transporter ATP-binding protein n=1 Tax=Salinarimonas sp. NSM TaxID=3458003 RepID=UPI004036C44C